MNCDIKTEPEVFEDTISQSDEFIYEKQNVAIITAPGVNSNTQQTFVPNTFESSQDCESKNLQPHIINSTECLTENIAIITEPGTNINMQQTFLPSTIGSSPCESNNVQPHIINSTDNFAPKTECSTLEIIQKLQQQEAAEVNIDRKKQDKFTSHWRKKFLGVFQKDGCSSSTIKKLALANDLNVEKVLDFYENAAKEAECFVYEECDSLSFNNITEWLRYFKNLRVSDQCNYEAAIVLNAITNNEQHPEARSLGGINLKAIYKFLSNALMGLPQKQLDQASAQFLSHEFQNLINEANTDEADNDVRDMKKKIEDSLVRTINGKSYNLDPLNTYTAELESCYENFKN